MTEGTHSTGTWDAVIVGSGIDGLVCGAKLAQEGARVVICEAMPYPGGYMATYTRQGFRFACGALSFSSPDVVGSILDGLGSKGSVQFLRSHFRYLSPDMDLVISHPFKELVPNLQKFFPGESE